MASASTLMNHQGRLTLVHTEKRKLMIKGTIPGRMLSSGISQVAFASVEKTRLKKSWIMIIIIMMNKSQELTVFHEHQNFRYETKARKVMVDFKFDALYI